MLVHDFGNKDELESRVVGVLCGCLSIACGEVQMNSRLVEDLCMDSIQIVEFVMAINDVFQTEVPDEEVAGWKAVQDVCCWLKVIGVSG